MTETTATPQDHEAAPTSTTGDDDEGPQPGPISVSVSELLESSVGALHDLDVKLIYDWTVAWSGRDQSGRPLSGKLTHDFRLAPDGKSIVLNWQVVLDGEGA